MSDIRINVYSKRELWIYGKDLRRIRCHNNISLQKVANTMNREGYAYYPTKIFRFERMINICLPGKELISLIRAVQGHFQLKT